MDGVGTARVHLPVGETPHPSASALLKLRGAGPPLGDVQKLIAGAAGLGPDDVRVVVTHAAPADEGAVADRRELVAVGPLRVERGSRRPLQAVLGVLLGLVLALSVVLVALARRMARLRERVSALERAGSDK